NFDWANISATAPGLSAAVRPNIELSLRKRRRDLSSRCFIVSSCLVVLDFVNGRIMHGPLLTSSPQSRNPLPNVRGTIPELDAIPFAFLEKTDRTLVHQYQLY